MRVTIFGATGRLGEQTIKAARNRGFAVTGYSRRPMVEADPEILWKTGDVSDAVEGADAILILFGPRSPSASPFCAGETGKILAGMQQHGVSNLICVTGAMVGDYPANRTWCFQQFASWIQRRYPAPMEDRARQERSVASSGVNWIIIKPPRLTNAETPRTVTAGPSVRVGLLSSVSRSDLARYMVEELDQGRFAQETIFIRQS